MIAGFETPTSGRSSSKARTSPAAPNQRKIGMVFQAYALFPNMNVAGNIGFGLKDRKGVPRPRSRRASRRC
jgi:putative spermidine/putrescine transport system ATP-binding protein